MNQLSGKVEMGEVPPQQNLEQTYARFATTNWTLIDALHRGEHPGKGAALELLIKRYWPPVYASLRRMGRQREEAAELTQAFFADVVLGRELFTQANANRGKLRTLLLTAVKHYVIDQHRRNTTRPGNQAVSIDDLSREEKFLTRESALDVDDLFDRRWAVAVLEEAVARCSRYFQETNLPNHWAVFDAFIVQPAIHVITPPPLSELATQFGFPSSTHAASAMKVVRKRMRIMLKEVIAETAAKPNDQEAEYQHVVALLSG